MGTKALFLTTDQSPFYAQYPKFWKELCMTRFEFIGLSIIIETSIWLSEKPLLSATILDFSDMR